jgi:hypothetical protein
MNKQIETYLQKATRGLWGSKRREVKEELSTHIEGRINAHLIAGLGEDEAVEKSLTELGQPKVVSTGMTKLYTLPVVAGSSLVLAGICALSITMLSKTTAQILERTSIFPSEFCLQTSKPKNTLDCTANEIWLSIEEIKNSLEPQGVKIIQEKQSIVLTFPNSDALISVDTRSSLTYYQGDRENQVAKPELQPVQGYITLWEFINKFIGRTGAPELKISGWKDITLSIGSTSLQINLDESLNESLYFNFLMAIVRNNFDRKGDLPVR